MADSKPPILIVEDSPEDFEATCRAFARAGVNTSIYRAQDGDELLDYLCRRGKFSSPDSAPRPGLILLDLNLPGTDGREALATIKGDSALTSIPVVVLTTSSDDRDIEICYRSGANSYIQKPVDLDEYMRLIRLVAEYWLGVVVLPKGDEDR
jgi:two-component system, response regulator